MSIAALFVAAVALGGCGALAPTARPEPTNWNPNGITPTPNLTPAPQPSEAALVAACAGKPVAGAAEIGGEQHPLVIVDGGGLLVAYSINDFYHQWTSPIQLVVCLGAHKTVTHDCGKVTRTWTTGTTVKMTYTAKGRLYLLQDQQAAKVVAAKTGKTLSSTTIDGELLTCSQVTNNYGPPEIGIEGVSKTWRISGDPVDAEDVDNFASDLLTKQLVSPSPAAAKS